MKNILLILSVFIAVSTAGAQDKTECLKTIENHGFLSRAQFQCNIKDYSADMMQSAQECYPVLGEKEAKNALGNGMKMFDYNEAKRGHDKICKDVLRDFPNILHNDTAQNAPPEPVHSDPVQEIKEQKEPIPDMAACLIKAGQYQFIGSMRQHMTYEEALQLRPDMKEIVEEMYHGNYAMYATEQVYEYLKRLCVEAYQ